MGKKESGLELIQKFTRRPVALHLLCEKLNFPDLNAFLHANDGEEPYGEDNVAAYIFGNGRTRVVPRKQLVGEYIIWGREDIARGIEKVLPEDIPLTHFAQVAMIAAKDPGDTVEKINACAVFPAEVLAIEGPKARVRRNRFPKFDDVEQVVELPAEEKVEVGDKVAIHLGAIMTRMTDSQFEDLDRWNKKVAKLV